MFTKQTNNMDATTWELPEGAIARLGQGLLGDVEFSRDGAYLSVATKIGFWIYDTETLNLRHYGVPNEACSMLLPSRKTRDGLLLVTMMALLRYGIHRTDSNRRLLTAITKFSCSFRKNVLKYRNMRVWTRCKAVRGHLQ